MSLAMSLTTLCQPTIIWFNSQLPEPCGIHASQIVLRERVFLIKTG
jgi:hypothetical protein